MRKCHCPHRRIKLSLFLIKWSSLRNSPGIRQQNIHLEGIFQLHFWNAKLRCYQWQKGPPFSSKQATATRKMTEKKAQKKGGMSKLTVSCSFFARFLNSLLSVFSRIWLYFTSASFMCPLKTSVDGLRCSLKVASEAASLTGWREVDESQVFDQQSCCEMASFDEKRWFLFPPTGLETLFKSYIWQRQLCTWTN